MLVMYFTFLHLYLGEEIVLLDPEVVRAGEIMRYLGILLDEFRVLLEEIHECMVSALIDERSDLRFYIFHCYWGVIGYKNHDLLYSFRGTMQNEIEIKNAKQIANIRES